MDPAMEVEDDEARRMPPAPYLPHELIVSEILLRLPVKSLMRFRCVCTAWRDTVSSDTSFSQAHVRRHQPQNKTPSGLLIAPYVSSYEATPGLYLLDENQRQDGNVATLVHDIDFFSADDNWKHEFAHCDGLVMLPAEDGTVRVLNPATRSSLTLPQSPNCETCSCCRFKGQVENTFGFGRDPSSGAYKVARFFHREIDTPFATCSLGMEVLTIGKDDWWRETAARPPCPFLARRTATFFKGALIWTVDLDSPAYEDTLYDDYGCAVQFVRFSLEDESFSIMDAPPGPGVPDYENFRLAELHGELAVSCPDYKSVTIWAYDDVDDGVKGPQWARRHVLNLTYCSCIRLVAAFDDGIVFREMFRGKSDFLWLHTSQGSKHMVSMNTLKYLDPDTLAEYSSITFDGFDVIPYIPTLVQILPS